MAAGEGSHSKLTSQGSLSLHRPSSPGRSASPFRIQLFGTAFYMSPITRPSCLNWELASVLVCRPQLHRSQAAEVLQTEQVRTRAHQARPATGPHLGIRGRRAACHLLLLAAVTRPPAPAALCESTAATSGQSSARSPSTRGDSRRSSPAGLDTRLSCQGST